MAKLIWRHEHVEGEERPHYEEIWEISECWFGRRGPRWYPLDYGAALAFLLTAGLSPDEAEWAMMGVEEDLRPALRPAGATFQPASADPVEVTVGNPAEALDSTQVTVTGPPADDLAELEAIHRQTTCCSQDCAISLAEAMGAGETDG